MLKNFMGLNASGLSDMLTFFNLQPKLTVCVCAEVAKNKPFQQGWGINSQSNIHVF